MVAEHREEYIRISSNSIELSVLGFTGIDGEFYVSYSPSLEISGYGSTVQESEESLKVSLTAFINDLKSLTKKNQEIALLSLGWSKVKLKNKNYSHSYIDKDGVIQGLGWEDVHTSEVELSI